MSIKAFIDKNKYALSVFALLAMLSSIYDGFENAATLLCRLLLCACVGLFSTVFLKNAVEKEGVVMPVFFLLSLISCNIIFLTDDIHILLSLSSFLIALFCSKKAIDLTPVFAGLCVMAQPLTLLILVPSIMAVQLIKKQLRPALFTFNLSVGLFITVKTLLKHSEFYADQFEAYHLSLHLVHFSRSYTEALASFFLCSIALVAVFAAYIIKLILNKKVLHSFALTATFLLSVYGVALSKNVHSVFMILVPAFAVMLSLNDFDGFREINKDFGRFFINHLFLFLLVVAFTAGFPTILGTLPYDSEFFSRSTFIIFRQE